MLNQWIKSNIKSAQTLPSLGYGDSDEDLFNELEELHRYWYTIQQLEGKMSGMAEKAKQDAVANFHHKSQNVVQKLNSRFSSWLHWHRLPGWWDRARAYFKENYQFYVAEKQRNPYGYSRNKPINVEDYNLPQQLINILAKRYAIDVLNKTDDIDIEEMIRSHEMYHGAFEFLKTSGKMEEGITDDVSAFQHVVEDDNLLHDYANFLKKTTDFSENFDPLNIYGNNWYEEMPQEFLDELDRADDLGAMAYEKFMRRWPNYTQVANNVEASLKRLSSAAANPQDIGGLMTAISLALNTAHNSGIMSEHVGLSEQEMDGLSNLDVSDIDEKAKRYMSWVRDNCRFAK